MEQAAKQSNIDAMMQQMSETEQEVPQEAPQGVPQQTPQRAPQEAPPPPATSSKVLKLATVALLFRKMKQEKVQSILNKFNPEDAQTVIKYMGMPDLESRVSVNTALRCLNEIRTNLPKPQEFSPSKIVAKIQNVTQGIERQQLETILKHERMKVRRLVFNALEGEYYEVPPKVANIIATHIQDSV